MGRVYSGGRHAATGLFMSGEQGEILTRLSIARRLFGESIQS
jgi:hypothetical protein